MNLLNLVNQVREECDVSRTGDLATLSGVTGESLLVKNWVIRSWREIQMMQSQWRWMRAAYSFTSTANDGSYTSTQAGISSRFGMWDKTYCSVYLTATGVNDQTELDWMDYEDFRSTYLTGTQSDSRPQHFTVGDANELLVGPKPDSTLYTVSGYYYKSPQELSADADEPELPEQHDVIAFRAMKKYSRYQAAPEIYAEADREERRVLRSLHNKYLPAIQFGDAII